MLTLALGASYPMWRKLSGGEGCALCDLTHRFVAEKSVVKAWRTQLRFSLRWLHLNELDAEIFDFVRGRRRVSSLKPMIG